MESEKYREFLKHQSGKRPLYKSVSAEKIILGVSQENREESSDILESILLDKKLSQSVTVDRKAASLLRYRLEMLEEENLQMHRKIRFMKIIIALMMSVTLSLLVYLILYFI